MSGASVGTGRRVGLRPTRLALSLAAAMVWTIAGCSGGDATQAPPSVAHVALTPSRASMEVGETLRLRASAEDAAGNVITDREARWSTDRPDIAMVSQRGEVTALSAGSASITASIDGKWGSAHVTVESRKVSVSITSVSPDPIVEGQPAVITGQGFDVVAANNKVTVDGASVTISEATATRLTIVVPAADCRPARKVDVRVTTTDDPQGRTVSSSLRPAASVNVAVGKLAMVRDPAKFCLQFSPSAAEEAYLVGVQSIAESSKSLTALKVEGISAASGGVTAPMLTPDFAPAKSFPISGDDVRADEIRRAHNAAESALREQERRVLQQIRRVDHAAMRPAPNAAAAGPFSGPLKVGDVINVRVPLMSNLCTDFTSINAVVRFVGTRGIWLEDVANPAGGYGVAEFQAFSQLFDQRLYDGDVESFGVPTDLDGNGRIAIVITKEVNRLQYSATTFLLGFVSAPDLISRNSCAASNEGEVFFGRTPDPAGAVGVKLGISDLVWRAPSNIAHELVHIIQMSHRIYGGQGNVVLPAIWESEGLATLAEELTGFRIEGRMPGRNYGGDVVEPLGGAIRWYAPVVDKLGVYYGWDPGKPRIPNAPEQCSWLERVSQGNTGPCYASDLLPYGVGWLFFRWLSDHYGPAFPGGEKGFQRAVVDLKGSGFAAVSALVGTPSDSLLAMFAAMQYVDDRVPGADLRLTLSSWNLPSVFSRGEDQLLVPRERPFGTFNDVVSVRGASTAYFRVSGAQRAGMAVRVRGSDGTVLPAHMRLWVVRLK